MKALTGSALDRAEACPASCALPSAKSTSAYAERGQVIHEFLERLQSMDRDASLEQVEDDDDRAACAAIETDGLPIGGYAAEVAFAFDTETCEARELGRGLGRDYSSAKPSEICGTIDVVGVAGDLAYVGDYKSGWGTIIPAHKSRQIHLAALCAATIYKAKDVVGDVICTRPGAKPWTSRGHFDSFEIGLIAREIQDIRSRVIDAKEIIAAGKIPDVVEGDHCRYCPSIHRCPAKVALALELGGGPDPKRIDDLVGELTAATAAAAYRRVGMIEGLCKTVRARIEQFAFARPVQIGPGRYLGKVDKRGKESLDGDAVFARVEQLYGDEIAAIAAPSQRKALKKSVSAAMREARVRKLITKAAPAERALLEELRKSGGVSRSPARTVVDEYEAAECATDGCAEQAMTNGGTCDLCALEAEHVSDAPAESEDDADGRTEATTNDAPADAEESESNAPATMPGWIDD